MIFNRLIDNAEKWGFFLIKTRIIIHLLKWDIFYQPPKGGRLFGYNFFVIFYIKGVGLYCKKKKKLYSTSSLMDLV